MAGAQKPKVGPRVICAKKIGRYEVAGLPKASPLFPNRPEAQKWMRTEIAKLPEASRPRDRACMCCGASFESQHIGNRLCPHCRIRGDASAMSVSANTTGRVRLVSKA